MGLKHLRRAASAGVLLLCLQGEGVLAYCGGEYGGGEGSPQTPVDSDCDGVPDERDACQELPGDESNAGCPAEIEVVVVTGLPSGVLCPNGQRAASKSHCPRYSSWRNSHTTLAYDSRTHQVSSLDGAAPCGSTVDAGCACGAGKVKVFDEDNDTFHCKNEPPDEGCPNWDQTFDFDLDVWACATRPFDKDPKVAADRLRKCMPNGMFNAHWDSLKNLLEYDPDLPALGQAKCSMVDGKPVTTAIKINLNLINRGSTTRVPGSSPWAWLADVLTHEAYHYDDYQKYNYCWKSWTGFTYSVKLKQEGYTVDEPGMEAYTNDRAWEDYYNELGVRAPEDPDRRTPANTQLPCTLER